MATATSEQRRSAANRACHIYELTQHILSFVDNGEDLLRIQSVCRFLNTHVRIIKQGITRCEANEDEFDLGLPDNIKLNRFLFPYTRTIFGRLLLADLPGAFVLTRTSKPFPEHFECSPLDMFISEPPVMTAHIIRYRNYCSYLHGAGADMRSRRIAGSCGISIGNVLSRVSKHAEPLNSFLIVLGGYEDVVKEA